MPKKFTSFFIELLSRSFIFSNANDLIFFNLFTGLFSRGQIPRDPSSAGDDWYLSRPEKDVPWPRLHQWRGVVQAEVKLPTENAQTQRGKTVSLSLIN